MKNQVKWGTALLVLGIVLLPFSRPYLLVYSLPLLAIGAGLIVFRNREGVVEDAAEGWARSGDAAMEDGE